MACFLDPFISNHWSLAEHKDSMQVGALQIYALPIGCITFLPEYFLALLVRLMPKEKTCCWA